MLSEANEIAIGETLNLKDLPPLDKTTKEQDKRSNRKVQYGIDCADELHFTHWEPAGEYVKYLIIKNVVMKTQKIRYKLPQSRYFSMEFPETQTLSAGMNWTIPVTFRPVAKECYEDYIEFTSSFGKFVLRIKATLPEHALDFPEKIDFEYRPIRETAKINFTLKNVGELTSYYEWNIEPPFFITPNIGELQPGTNCQMLLEFKPMECLVVEAIAVCSFGVKDKWEKTKRQKTCKVFGISKFSHIICSEIEPKFDFGEVYVGTSLSKTITLRNPSPVAANFRIRKAEGNNGDCFDFSAVSGTIESGKQNEITVTYTPSASSLVSNSYYLISTISGNTINMIASGRGIGPKVTLEPAVLNFNDIPAGETVARAFYIKNESSIQATYHFQIESLENSGSFQLTNPFGVIGPHSTIALQFKICPTDPINYYRRIYCLVENQDAVYIDLLATCYNDSRRPATFRYHHVLNYQKRLENGLWQYGPEQLEAMLKSQLIHVENGVLNYVEPDNTKKCKVSDRDQPYNHGKVSSEFFFSNSGPQTTCSLLDTYVDFGSCSTYRAIEPRIIRVSNHTNGKMACVWINYENDPLFSVSPKIADIAAKSTVEFKVFFRPTVENEFYGRTLECYCYFKSMRNFRLVSEETFTPPWCLTPTVAGNTFPSGKDTFIPKIGWGKTKLIFPSCYVDRSEYQIMQIANTGDTTVKFSFLDVGTMASLGIGGDVAFASNGGPVFSVKPRVGVLEKNEKKLIVFRFSPGENRLFDEANICYFNNSIHSNYNLQTKGYGSYPSLLFDSSNKISFKPTCLGSISERKFSARNKSKVLLNYEWKIPIHYSSIVKISPLKGTLDADATMDLSCVFAPITETNYNLKIPCYFSHDNADTEQRRTTFVITGSGVVGKLTCSTDTLVFDNILVNTITESEVTIFNPSPCDFYISIYLNSKSVINDVTTTIENCSSLDELEISIKSKILPARSSETLRVKLCLKTQSLYEFGVNYKIEKSADNMNEFGYEAPIQPLFTVKAKGVHPIMSITDVRSENISKTVLWQLLSLDRFNELLKIPSDNPMAFVEPKMDEDTFSTEPAELDLNPLEADINFDFGALSVGSLPSICKICLKNSGVVPVDWAFNFPNDYEVKVESWADPCDNDQQSITKNFILDNSIFCVSPKFGKLEPGQHAEIMMSYSHEFPGPHRIPVAFRLRNGTSMVGKEIMINFIGYSVPERQKFLHLQSINYQFSPIMFGTPYPPIQFYRLMNCSTRHLSYRINTEPIDALNKENMNFEIIKCLTTSGEIKPGEIQYLEFIFNPLEEKEYELDLPITVDNGKTRIITFRGRGINDKKLFQKDTLLDPRMIEQSIPNQPTLSPFNDPIASISLERIEFGHCPVRTVVRQILVVTNTTSNHKLQVSWIIPQVWPKDSISVFPKKCVLHPEESKIFKIVFEPDDHPRLYDFNIICEISNETAIKKYKEINPTEEELKLKLGEIMEDSKKPALEKLHNPTIGSKIDKYYPLPAINSKNDSCIEYSNIVKVSERLMEFPKPVRYFVGINAQSHNESEFKSLFDGYHTFFRKFRTGYKQVAEANVQDFAVESALFTDLLSNLLNEVFQDSSIQSLPEKIINEPIPFYKVRKEIKNTKENGLKFEDVKSCPDFKNSLESVLEGTIYNLAQEIILGDFDPVSYPMLVSREELIKKHKAN